MVVKSLFTAAFLLSCTLAWGDCPDGKCSSGECKSGECSSKCTAEGECAEGECCKEECALTECDEQKGAKQKCAKSQCCKGEEADLKCSTESTEECLKESCDLAKCALEKCSGGECAKGKCSKGDCATSQCADDACDAGGCPLEQCALAAAKCTRGECSADQCAVAEVAADVCASLKCAVAACTKTGADAKCSQGNCDAGKCGDRKCSAEKVCGADKQCTAGKRGDSSCASVECVAERSVGQCETSQSPIEVRLAAIAQLQREIADLRTAAGRPEQLKVCVKVVEIDHSKCRKLGFDLQTASMPGFEIDSQLVEALEKNNLLKVVANPTLVLTAGRAGQFVSGIETSLASGGGQQVEREFIGTKVDVLATTVGDSKIRVEIRPEFSELDHSNGERSSVKVRCWDTGFETTLGKTVVIDGLSQSRVRAARHGLGGEGASRVVEEIVEIQTLLLVTVENATPIASASISQAAYEESLVSLVQEPECVTKVYAVPDLQVWKVRPGGVEFDAELLVNHIQSAVAPNSWRSEANPGADAAIEAFERNGSLVICQTKANHQAIAKMLNKLRNAHGEEEVSVGILHPAPKANGKCAESQETLKCSAVEGCTTDVKLAFGKRFMELPSAEVEEEPYPIGECSTGFSVEPSCHDGHCTR